MTERRPPAPEVDLDKRASLNGAKLAALVTDRWGTAPANRRALGSGAAFTIDDVAYLLLDGDHGFGAALAWADRAGATSMRIIADHGGEILARQAVGFDFPVEVFRSVGRELIAVEAADYSELGSPPDAPALVGLFHQHDVEVVVEGDRLAAEINGLEIARIVRALDDGEPVLEVGVGKFDRGLTTMVHGELPEDALGRVVEQIRGLRRADGPNHPLTTLVPERWLRARIVADPSMVDCDTLVSAPSPAVRDRLRERGIASAIGTAGGESVVVVCTVGVDLDAVADAADAHAMLDPTASLVLAMPNRDVLPVVERMVARLRADARIARVADDWRG